MKPKFEIGQLVTIEFNGQIEGEPVTVSKRVYISGVRWSRTNDNLGWRFLYSLCETLPKYPQDGFGKNWSDIEEYRLTTVEPVIEAISNAAVA